MHRLFDFALEPRLANTEDLYIRRSGCELSFDTYFNAIPIAKIKKYTEITELIFDFKAEGKFEVDICTEHKILTSQALDTSGKIAVSVADIPDDSVLLFPVVRTNGLRRITVFAESKNVSSISCALIICTYKREPYVTKNANYLTENLSHTTDFDCKIIVVDNGRTLTESSFADEVMLLSNPNTGGSGGFGRGMRKAAKIGSFTHLLLMDDDVEIDFTALQKTLNFLKFLKLEYADISVAGSMFYLDNLIRQFEAGGHFYEDGSQQGFGHFLDLSKAENLVLNEADNDINYGGWWYMCMPIKYAQEGNFPLPFFLKYDDVEYALRCKQRIITLNGVGIWHERFENKYNSASEYYNTRNYLHLCKLYCKDFTKKKVKQFVSDRIRAKVNRQQYQMAEAVMMGYRDYKRGLKYLQKIDAEKKHEQVCRLNYKFLTYDEIYSLYGFRPNDDTFYPPPDKLSVRQKSQPKEYVFTDAYQDVPEQYEGAEYAVHCDCMRNVGYVTKVNSEYLSYIKK